jgi:hypothetical protein
LSSHGIASPTSGSSALAARCRIQSSPGRPPRRGTNSQYRAGADNVSRVTVNDIYKSHIQGFFPFIVKVDIEGGEIDLFAAHTEWVARTPLIIVELHDWLLPKGRTAAPFLRCIAQLDRDFVCIGKNIYSIANDLDALAPPTP